MGFSAIWHIFKHIKLHVFFVHSCWDCKSPDKCLHRNTEWKAFIYYFLQCSLCRHCILVGGSDCLVLDRWNSEIQDLDPGSNLSAVLQPWDEPYKVLCLDSFFVFHLEALLSWLLPAPHMGCGFPDLPLSREAGSWCTFTSCSIALPAAVSADVQRRPTDVWDGQACAQWGLWADSPPCCCWVPLLSQAHRPTRECWHPSQDPRHTMFLHAQRQMLKGVFSELLAIFVWSICSTVCFLAVSYSLKQGRSQGFESQV